MHALKQNLTPSVLILTLLLPVLFFVFFDSHNTAQAQAVPFGGRILNVIYCGCSMNYHITVGPPVPAYVIYEPFASTTKLYPFYQITRPGPWVLGIYYPGSFSVCSIPVGWGCLPVGWGPIINIVGTSM